MTEGGYRFDWRQAAVTFLLIAGQGLIQYGVIVNKVDELGRRVERLENKLDEKFLTRDEFEKRNGDLREKVQDLMERLRELERRHSTK